MESLLTIIFLFVINLYFSLFLNFNQTNKNLISLILFFIFMSLFVIFYYKFEFLGYAYLLVYVGAIAVLFLFLLISVNIKVESKKTVFNSQFINFFFLFNFICIPLYLFFSNLYIKIKNVNYIQYYIDFFDVKSDTLSRYYDIADKTDALSLYNGNFERKLDSLNNVLTQSYRGNILIIDNNSFFRYTNNKISILGDYFLIYNNFFLIVISLLLFVSIIVSVTICLSNENKELFKK